MSYQNLSQEAYEKLKLRIIRMEVNVGHIMTESSIADDFGIGLSPVREAIQRLKYEGFVKVIPHKGVLVNSLSPDEIRQIYDMHDALSGTVVRLASEKASKSQINELNNIISEMKRSLTVNDMECWVKADDAFHAKILEMCNNSYIARAMGLIRGLLSRVRIIITQVKGLPSKSTNDHEQVVRMISEHRGNDARDAMHQHHERIIEDIMDIVRQLKWI